MGCADDYEKGLPLDLGHLNLLIDMTGRRNGSFVSLWKADLVWGQSGAAGAEQRSLNMTRPLEIVDFQLKRQRKEAELEPLQSSHCNGHLGT